jgi:hypothetical protein
MKRNSLCAMAMPSDLTRRRYTSHVVSYEWQTLWREGGSTLKEYSADAIMMQLLLCVPKNRTTIVHRYLLTYILRLGFSVSTSTVIKPHGH